MAAGAVAARLLAARLAGFGHPSPIAPTCTCAASRRHLSPTTIAVNISILGLSLYASGWPAMGACIQLGLPVLILITLFAFHLRRVTIFGLPVFSLFPVFLGLGLTW